MAAQVVSVIDAAHEALGHTRRQLFPLRVSRWLTLGFVAFLDQCGRGTGFGGEGVPGAPAAEGGFDPKPLLRWALANPVPALLVGAAVLAAVVALVAIILWINSRGSFVYADLVATGRAEVAGPWAAHRSAARSYFVVRFALVAVTIAGLAAMAAALAVLALALAALSRPRPGYLLIGFGLLFLMLFFAILMSLLSVLLRDFVVPLQLQAGLAAAPAARLLRSLVAAHPGAFAVYLLLKVVFALGVAAAMIVVCCSTCALGLLPVLGQTLLQPAYYFERAWSMFLLRQMGYDTFAALAPAV
jgi:hypothetical protein